MQIQPGPWGKILLADSEINMPKRTAKVMLTEGMGIVIEEPIQSESDIRTVMNSNSTCIELTPKNINNPQPGEATVLKQTFIINKRNIKLVEMNETSELTIARGLSLQS